MADKMKYSFFNHPETFQHYLAPYRFKIEAHGEQALALIDEYVNNPEEFIRTFTVVINGKRRNIITYQPNVKGAKLRNLQRMFVCVLRGMYQPSKYSYAYKEGTSTKACLERHMTNDHFFKTDIHAYFDSVSFDLLKEKVLALNPVMRRKHVYWEKILSACFYEGKMPIGFVSSPMLSDIFLKDVDERFGSMEGISYTRYADDFIISSAGDDADKRLHYVLDELTNEMRARQLELNKKKTYFRHLRLEGDAIHILGLNLVRTAGETARITVSDRFIRETSVELCLLMQQKEQLSDWEARKRFCAVMGKVGYITYASEHSTRKLQKMLQVKTGRMIPLDYKSLQSACMKNPSANAEYQQRQYDAAYAKAIDFSSLPSEGLVWERASVRATAEKEMHALKFYIMGLCRAAENSLHIRNVRLTIGSDTFIATSNADVQALREEARKLRDTQEAVSFYAQYQYSNPTEGRHLKRGNVWIIDGSYRPLLGMVGVVSHTMESCAVCDTEGLIWKLADQKGRQDARALTECNVSILMTHEAWQGDIQFDAHWPLATDEPAQVQIQSLLAQLPFCTETNNGCRAAHSAQKLHLSAEQAICMVNTLRELGAVIKQADGELQLECTLFPAGYLESVDETPLTFVNITGGKSCIISLKACTFQ